jgi:hypothetical protein
MMSYNGYFIDDEGNLAMKDVNGEKLIIRESEYRKNSDKVPSGYFKDLGGNIHHTSDVAKNIFDYSV